MKIAINKHSFPILLFLYFFIFWNWLQTVFPILNYVDEFIAISSVPLAIIQYKANHGLYVIRRGGFGRYIVYLILLGFAGNFVFHYQPILEAALPDALIVSKFWLAIYVGKMVRQNLDMKRYAKTLLFHIKLITWFYTLLIIINRIHPMFREVMRYGLYSTQLFYSHSSVFGSCCALLLTILLLLHGGISKRDETVYSVWLSLLMISTLRSKAFGSAVIFWLIWYFVFIRKKKITIKTMILFLPLILSVGWGQIEYYYNNIKTGFAREELLTTSFQVANDHFPLGAGFATYNSHYSGVYYSPLYRMYGLDSVHGLQEGRTSFISDSFWPMILGQFGWIGLLLFVLALYFLYRRIQQMKSIDLSLYAAGLFILAFLLVDSTASSSFVHPQSMPFAMLLGYILSWKEPQGPGAYSYSAGFNRNRRQALMGQLIRRRISDEGHS